MGMTYAQLLRGRSALHTVSLSEPASPGHPTAKGSSNEQQWFFLRTDRRRGNKQLQYIYMEATHTSSSLSEAFSWKVSSVEFLPPGRPPASRPVSMYATPAGPPLAPIVVRACRDGTVHMATVWRIYRRMRLQCHFAFMHAFSWVEDSSNFFLFLQHHLSTVFFLLLSYPSLPCS
jgi:hypothetical protein